MRTLWDAVTKEINRSKKWEKTFERVKKVLKIVANETKITYRMHDSVAIRFKGKFEYIAGDKLGLWTRKNNKINMVKFHQSRCRNEQY